MIVRKAFLVMVSLILLTGSFIFLIPDGKVGGEEVDDEPDADITITSTLYVNSGQVRTFNGDNVLVRANIYVRSGGRLEIINSNFVWDCTSRGSSGGQRQLDINSGGELYIESSTMTANDKTSRVTPSTTAFWTETWGYQWEFEFYGSGYIGNSTLSYMWGDDGTSSSYFDAGLQLFNDDITIYNTVINNCSQAGVSIYYCSPTLDKVTVKDNQGTGLLVYPYSSNPDITNSTFKDNTYYGSYWYYGYPRRLSNTDFLNNQDWGLYFYSASYDYQFYADNCSFNGNDGSGVGSYGDSDMIFTDCEFNRNTWSGIESYTSSYERYFSFLRCDFKDNQLYGVDAYHYRTYVYVDECDISGNWAHGVYAQNTPSEYLYVRDSEIYNNREWGVYFNPDGSWETSGHVIGNDIHNNIIGNVRITNGSYPFIDDNTISDAPIGLLVELDGYIISLSGNDFSDNDINIDLRNRSMDFGSNNIKGGDIGVLINPELSVNLTGFTIEDIVDSAVKVVEKGKIWIWSSSFLNNNKDVTLDKESMGMSHLSNIPKSQVQILDPLSDFMAYSSISTIIVDNVTFDPIEKANLIVYNPSLEVIVNAKTDETGEASGIALQFSIIDGVTTENSPVNITVVKDGYVPYWGGGEPFTGNIDQTIPFSVNMAPTFPDDWTFTPKETHLQKPTLDWSDAYDWNDDVIKYRVNIYLDELQTGDQVVRDEIRRITDFTFTKNLRFNRIYWVEVEAYDDWGLSDTIVFSFNMINTPPTEPEIALLESPVSALDDITIVIMNESVDVDTNPVDPIHYLVEWYAYREESWVLLASGINLTTLSSDKTKEGEEIKVVVKSYDGIGYGTGVEMIIPVVNFVPVNLIPYVDIVIDEDGEGIDLIDLRSFFDDRDGDDLSFRVKKERHVIAVIDSVTNNVTFVPDPDWVGWDQVLIEGFDTKMHEEEWPFVTVNVTVNPINDAPNIDLVNDKSVGFGEVVIVEGTQGSPEVITVAGSDPDEIYDDEFTFSTDFLEVVGEENIPEEDYQFEVNTGRLSIYLSNDLVGVHLFNITITDLELESSSVQIRLYVENINDVMTDPEITGPANGATLTQEEGGSISFTAAECFDPDMLIPESEEELSYEWDFGDGSDPLTNAGRDVSHSFLVEGNYTVTLTVKDSSGYAKTATVKVYVELPGIIVDDDDVTDEGDDRLVALVVILIIVGIIFLLIILFFVFKKDPLQDTAEAEEKAHEALVAQQQQDALIAQEKLQALLSGTAYSELSGPALPAAGGEGADMEALPAAPTEEVPGQEPPTEPIPEQPPMQEPPMEQPVYDQAPPAAPEPVPEPAPAPVPEPAPEPQPAPMQAAPAGTVPVPETPPAQDNLPPQEEQQQ